MFTYNEFTKDICKIGKRIKMCVLQLEQHYKRNTNYKTQLEHYKPENNKIMDLHTMYQERGIRKF